MVLFSTLVISCGALPAPKNGRKSTFAYTPGTFVKFDCDPGYVLIGEDRRWCYASAEWNWALWGDAQCIRKSTTKICFYVASCLFLRNSKIR